MTVTEIQKALAGKGFDPGVIDGVWGRRTALAVRAFQASRNLVVDGVVGPLTAKALGIDAKAPNGLENVSFVWFQEALRLRGLRETPGQADNRVIMKFAEDLGIPYEGDDVAWCGLFVAHCIGATMTHEPLPNNPLSARAWMKFGGPCVAQAGAVAVFWRGSKTGWQGHVGFYAGEEDAAYHVLGGNQSDSVNVTRIAKTRSLGFRWPATAPVGTNKPLKVDAGGEILSTNEG